MKDLIDATSEFIKQVLIVWLKPDANKNEDNQKGRQ